RLHSPTSRSSFSLLLPPPPTSPLFPYTTLFRSHLSGGRPARLDEPHPRSRRRRREALPGRAPGTVDPAALQGAAGHHRHSRDGRSEEHTSELQSPYDLVCRLLLEKKNKKV